MFFSRQRSDARYPPAPFGPSAAFPELASLVEDRTPANPVYEMFRELLRDFGDAPDRFGTADWDPLAKLVAGRKRVVVKPNLVLHRVGQLECTALSLVVHASVLRVIVDYLLLAAQRLGQELEVTIADTPLQSADFDAILRESGLGELAAYYRSRGLPVRVLDLRSEHAVINDDFLILERVPLPGDPRGAVLVDLGRHSAHEEVPRHRRRYSIQDYDDAITCDNHRDGVHRYCLSRTVLEADLIVNVCKLKTHAKAGVTLAMKNLIGANVSKDYLPHFVRGGPEDGGDEFPSSTLGRRLVRNAREFFYRHPRLAPVHRALKRAMMRTAALTAPTEAYVATYGGAWYGNDTVWRTIVDVNRAVWFGDTEGALRESPQRALVHVVDGICAMEGDGPLKGTDRPVGLLAIGDDPVEFDARLAFLMGFDPQAIPHVAYWREERARAIGRFPGIERSDFPHDRFRFREPSGWKGKLLR